MNYSCSKERMEDKIKTFSRIGDAGHGGITRYSLSEEALDARREFIKRMEAIGAEICTDDLANVYATLPGTDKAAKRIAMGSHCDSVQNGGNYDGILGVMSAMEVLETIAEYKIPHKHPITAMIWTNEEGSLYPPVMMCSGIVCHEYLPEDIKPSYIYEDMMKSVSMIDHVTTFGSKLAQSGFVGDKSNRMSRENTLCDFETHIEQGPILEENGMDLGVVDCVFGMYHYKVRLFGQTTHAGTFPMPKRKDAFYAAANVLLYIHEKIDEIKDKDLVYTTGEVNVHPNINTCVPDYLEFSFDVRHFDVKMLDKVAEIIESLPDKEWFGCSCEIERSWKRDTVFFDEKLKGYVKETAEELEIKHQWIHSGAGHDAQFISYMVPTTMIFAPSRGGLSHCEDEYTSVEQCTSAATVMLGAVLKADSDFE